jgi:hypothetical protein
MTRLNYGPRLDIIGKDSVPGPKDAEDYRDDICELFGQVYTEESDDMIPPEGLLDFEDKR